MRANPQAPEPTTEREGETLNAHIGIEELADHSAGSVPAVRDQQIERHLGQCRDCSARLQSLDQVSRLLGMPATIGTTLTPNFYYSISTARLTMLARSGAVRARLPKELAPLEVVPGLGLVSVMFFRLSTHFDRTSGDIVCQRSPLVVSHIRVGKVLRLPKAWL